MSPLMDIVSVRVLADYRLQCVFESGERRVLDMQPHLGRRPFTALQDQQIFRQVALANGTLSWPGDIEVDPESVYLNSRLAPEVLP